MSAAREVVHAVSVPPPAMVPDGARLPREDFPALVEAHRRELLAHCYRMTGSLADAEELTQETFLRAWRGRERFRGGSSPRTWLYRIATNACLDFLKNHERRARPSDSIADTLEQDAGIDPFPDVQDPATLVAQAQTTDLYLTAALLHLPPRQRAAVVARDLLELGAAESAEILETTPAAVNSLLQRAHTRLRDLGTDVDELAVPEAGAEEDEIVRAYVDAHARGDLAGILGLLSEDVRIAMPPEAPCHGLREAEEFFAHLLGPDGPGAWELVPTRANGAPAVANYLRPPGEETARATSIDVLRVRAGRIVGIHCFLGDAPFPAFGLDLLSPTPVEIDGGSA